MDATSSKRLKFEADNVDRISHLPENVIHYILSFLPTKTAVRTSLLSSTWKFLWISVHNLDFYDGLTSASKKDILKKKKPFLDFVDKVLRVSDVKNIERFSLSCQECDEAHFDNWAVVILRRNVQELILSIASKPPFMFPYSIFSCESLRVLKITMEASICIPDSICFSSLKILHLEKISITSPIHQVSLSFPVLEELGLYYCMWVEMKTINIIAPLLQRLRIKDTSTNQLHDSVMKIEAESLISLNLETHITCEYSLCHLSSLVDVVIEVPFCFEISEDNIVHRLGSLLRGVYNVRALELNIDAIKCLSRPAFTSQICSLSRLIHLRLGRGLSLNGRKFIDMLAKMPNIESIFFPNGLRSFRFKGKGRILGTTPNYFLSHLKLVDIKYFRGILDEQWFIKFLIKSAKVTDNFTVKLKRSHPHVEWSKSTMEKLELLVKDSNCALEFL
ncbi:hypothetical protein ACHQM5_013709 [Ranunculus cassubicifolius]